MHCNDKEVLNVVLSDTICSYSSWSETWSKDVGKIYFSSNYDTASDFYRTGKLLITFIFTVMCNVSFDKGW